MRNVFSIFKLQYGFENYSENTIMRWATDELFMCEPY